MNQRTVRTNTGSAALIQVNARRRRRRDNAVVEFLAQLAAWCGMPPPGVTAIGMLMAGVVASPLHCAPMCGGFVLGQVSDRMARVNLCEFSQCRRVREAALAPYHLGRLTTYTGLGFLAGAGGAAVRHAWPFLILGATLLAAQAAKRAWPMMPLPVRPTLRGYPLGVTLGFLPCGILYAALSASAATGSPVAAAVAMLCFALGTIPALFVTGWLGVAAGGWSALSLTRFASAVLGFNALVLAALGLRDVL